MNLPRGFERFWVVAVPPPAVLLLLMLTLGSDLFGSTGAGAALGQAPPADAAPAAPRPTRGLESGDGPVILAGQEGVFGPMLGMSETLPGQCRMAGANIDRSIITATYKCSAGDVVVTLRHVSMASRSATKTAHFGIAVESGSPPDGFVEALAELVRAHEAKVQWMWPEGAAEPAGSLPSLSIIVAGIGLAGVALGVVLRRRRRR